MKGRAFPLRKLTSLLLLTAAAWVFAAPLPTRAGFGSDPLLFISERADVHLQPRRAHSNFFKVVQGANYTYGIRDGRQDTLFDADEFYKTIEERRARAKDVPIVLFVHGCCVSFGEQLLQATDLQKAIDRTYARTTGSESGRPVTISYDWAAPFSYASSLEKCYSAQPRFDSFIRDLVARYGAQNIIIVGHSLGTLMVENYIGQIGDREKFTPFRAIVFSRPDIDRQTFTDCLPALKLFSKRLIILSSHNDPNIYFSSTLRWMGVKFFKAAILPTKLSYEFSRYIRTGELVGAPGTGGAAKAGGEAATASDAGGDSAAAVPGAASNGVDHSSKEAAAGAVETQAAVSETIGKGVLAPESVSAKNDEESILDVATTDKEKGLSRTVRNRRLGQVKAAREFSSVAEVYDLSSFRIGHGIPYHFIGDLIFNDVQDFALKKDVNGVVTVQRARP